MKILEKRKRRPKTYLRAISRTLRKGFTYFLIYYYFFFSSVVCAGTHPRVWAQETIGIEEQRGPSSQAKPPPLEEEQATGPVSFSISKSLFSRLTSTFTDSLSDIKTKLTNSAKKVLLEKAGAFSEWAYEGLKDVAPLLLAKSPFEIDYAHDKVFWKAHYVAVIDELQEGSFAPAQVQTRLEELQDLVLSGLLSPYHYNQGLKELEDQLSQEEIKAIQQQLKHSLFNSFALLETYFKEDVFRSFKKLQGTTSGEQEFKEILTFYRPYINSLDYTYTLKAFRAHLQTKKEDSKLTKGQQKGLLAALNEAITKSHKQERKSLKLGRLLFNQRAQTLPFYTEEIDRQGVWADVQEDESLTPTTQSVRLSNSSSSPLTSIAKRLAHACQKGLEYATNHPIQAITTVLATQVAAAAAFNAFLNSVSKTGKLTQRGESQGTEPPLSLPREEIQLHSYGKRAIGDEFTINQNTTSNQQKSCIASLNNRNAFVVWEGYQTGNWDIYGRLFDANGISLGNDFRINQNTILSQEWPSVTNLTNDTVFVAWHGSQTGNQDIYGRLFFPNGTTLSNEFDINQDTTSDQYTPFVTSLTNGNAFVVWTGVQNGYSDIYGRIFYTNGTVLSNEFGINQVTASAQQYPSVASLTNSNIFAAWQGSQTGDHDIYGRIFSSNGTALTNDFRINQNITSNQQYPSVASLTNGNTFVAWMGSQAGNFDIYGRIFSSNGTALSNEFVINQNTASDQIKSSLVGLANGNAFVAWQGNQTGSPDIYGRIFSSNGTALSNEFGINQIIVFDQYSSSVASLTNGAVFTAWGGDQTGNSDIYGRIFTNDTLSSLILPSTTGSLPTTIFLTTASLTSGLGTTGGATTGNAATTLNQGTSSILTSNFITTSSPAQTSSMNKGGSISVPVIAGVAGGVGGIACLTAGGFTTWKYFKHKKDSQERPASLELGRLSSDPFAAVTEQGIESLSTKTIDGAFGGHFAKYETTNKKLYQLIEEQTGKKVLTPDLSIGRGAYGEITVVRNIVTGEFVADKTVTGAKQIEESLNEGRIQDALIKANVPNVVPLLDYVRKVDLQGVEVLHQIMPLAVWNGEELKVKRSLLEDQPLKDRLLHHVAKKLLEGISYMHSAGYYHLDLKPTNFLVMQDMTVYLADFGRTKKIETPNQAKEDLLGDRRYFSPNLYSYIRHRWKEKGAEIEVDEISPTFSAEVADSWALGVTLLEIELNQLPFNKADYSTMVTSWRKDDFQNMVANLPSLQNPPSHSVLSVVKKLLVADPKKSSPLAQVLKDSLFKQKAKGISPEEGKQIFRRLSVVAPKEIEGSIESNPNLIVYVAGQESKGGENYIYNNSTTALPKDKDENYHYDPHHKKPSSSAAYFTPVSESSLNPNVYATNH